MAKNPRPSLPVYANIVCPDCRVYHRWERIGQRSKATNKKWAGTKQLLYGWKTTECFGPSAKGGRLYIEELAA